MKPSDKTSIVTDSIRLSSVFLILRGLDVEVKLLAGDALVELKDLLRGDLEVRLRVVALGNEEVLIFAVADWLVLSCDLGECLKVGSEEIEGGADFQLRS